MEKRIESLEKRVTELESTLSKLNIDTLLAKVGYLETTKAVSESTKPKAKAKAGTSTASEKRGPSTYIFFHQQASSCNNFPEVLEQLTGYKIPEEYSFENLTAKAQEELDEDIEKNGPNDAKGKEKKLSYSKTKWGQELWGKTDDPIKTKKEITSKLEKMIEILQKEQTGKLSISDYGTERLLKDMNGEDDSDESEEAVKTPMKKDDTLF